MQTHCNYNIQYATPPRSPAQRAVSLSPLSTQLGPSSTTRRCRRGRRGRRPSLRRLSLHQRPRRLRDEPRGALHRDIRRRLHLHRRAPALHDRAHHERVRLCRIGERTPEPDSERCTRIAVRQRALMRALDERRCESVVYVSAVSSSQRDGEDGRRRTSSKERVVAPHVGRVRRAAVQRQRSP